MLAFWISTFWMSAFWILTLQRRSGGKPYSEATAKQRKIDGKILEDFNSASSQFSVV
jgi:hypothetical protein